jgi:hypothetical protein
MTAQNAHQDLFAIPGAVPQKDQLTAKLTPEKEEPATLYCENNKAREEKAHHNDAY